MTKVKAILVLGLLFLIPQGVLAKAPPSPPPSYYSFEDLRGGLREEEFYFANVNKPVYAKVDLGYFPVSAANWKKAGNIIPRVYFNSSTYRAKRSNIWSRWNDSDYNEFDWTRFRNEEGARGDLIFLRANGKGPTLIKIFSNWTHVAIVDDISYQNVFESMPDTGVDVNWALSSWGNSVTYFTSKKIQALSYEQVWNALDKAENDYRGLPYFPRVETGKDLFTFLYRWSDKDDMESMYCSKLVYHAFKDYVNLDTNNTGTFNDKMQDKAPWAPAFSWVGISPDDIYYADALGSDFAYSSNLDSL